MSSAALRWWLSSLPALLLTGCVGIGTYDEVVEQRDALSERVRLLEASNEALDSERVALLDGLEDLRLERATLDRDVRSLRSEAARLSKSLSARERELARQNAEVARLRGTYQALVSDLEEEVAAGQIEIQQLREGLRVNVSDYILFSSGSATLGSQGRAVLRKVANQLGKLTHGIVVEGHTDNVPIRGALTNRYPSNWELAGARAASVVRLFEESGIDGARLSAISYAETKPVAENDTPEHRALNRRIEIRLLPERGAASDVEDEPGKAPASTGRADPAEPAGGGASPRPARAAGS